MQLLSERSQFEKAMSCVIPTIRHSGRSKTVKTVKGWVVPRGWGSEGWIGRAQRILRTVKLLSMTLWWWVLVIIHCPNPQKAQPQEWSPMQTRDSGWRWCAHIGASIVTQVPPGGDAADGEAVGGSGMWKSSTFFSVLSWTDNWSKLGSIFTKWKMEGRAESAVQV